MNIAANGNELAEIFGALDPDNQVRLLRYARKMRDAERGAMAAVDGRTSGVRAPGVGGGQKIEKEEGQT